MTRKVRVLDVAYNASNNELVRTQTLVKGAIIQVDAAPFKQWYQQHYGVEVGLKKKGGGGGAAAEGEAAAQSSHVKRKLKQRNQGRKLDQLLDDQFSTGRLYASIASRPGQVRGQVWGGARAAASSAPTPHKPVRLIICCRAAVLPCSAAAATATSWRAASWSST